MCMIGYHLYHSSYCIVLLALLATIASIVSDPIEIETTCNVFRDVDTTTQETKESNK